MANCSSPRSTTLDYCYEGEDAELCHRSCRTRQGKLLHSILPTLFKQDILIDKREEIVRARDKGSVRVKYPNVLSKYSNIFKNLGIDTQ